MRAFAACFLLLVALVGGCKEVAPGWEKVPLEEIGLHPYAPGQAAPAAYRLRHGESECLVYWWRNTVPSIRSASEEYAGDVLVTAKATKGSSIVFFLFALPGSGPPRNMTGAPIAVATFDERCGAHMALLPSLIAEGYARALRVPVRGSYSEEFE